VSRIGGRELVSVDLVKHPWGRVAENVGGVLCRLTSVHQEARGRVAQLVGYEMRKSRRFHDLPELAAIVARVHGRPTSGADHKIEVLPKVSVTQSLFRLTCFVRPKNRHNSVGKVE